MDTLTISKPVSTATKMKIDIWSDIMCPFCYIGKRKLEAALQQFPGRDEIEVVWHSFQLDTTVRKQKDKDLYDYLAERKGQTREWSIKMHDHVAREAKQVGLEYNFDKAVIANSFDAHRLIQLAKKHGLGDEAEERLFKAYFTDGEDISNPVTLLRLGDEIGLDTNDISDVLATDLFVKEVRKDIELANTMNIRGVPFFIMNDKYSVSGAQPIHVFLEALGKSFDEWKKNILFSNGETFGNAKVCTPEDGCN